MLEQRRLDVGWVGDDAQGAERRHRLRRCQGMHASRTAASLLNLVVQTGRDRGCMKRSKLDVITNGKRG